MVSRRVTLTSESRSAVRSPVTARQVVIACATLSAVTLGLSFRLGAEPVWRYSEQRCFAVVGEMVRSGDWLVPRMGENAAPRLSKPPLFYWAASLSAKVAGEASVSSLRSVSVLCGVALAIVVFVWGRSLAGFSGGIASMLSLAATALFVVRSRYGDAEPLLALTTTVSLLTFESLWRTRDARLLPILAGAVALGFLTKGTAALLVVFTPIVVWLAIHRELRLLLRPRILAWSAVSAVVGLSWYAVILGTVPGALEQLVSSASLPVGGSSAGAESVHYRSFLYYLPRFPLQALPASLLLPWLVIDGVRTRFWRGDERLRFVATSFVAIFVAWSLVPQKQMHYLLPLAPLLALLCGSWISRALPKGLR